MLTWLLVVLATVAVVLVTTATALWRMLWRVRNQPEFPPYRPTASPPETSQ
ncbi:hypothetical protein SAMN04489729_4250 [Amycolatopsis lurida]|uniref:hypothetical protein n=1 Tax=Amycolatopsis lurida TaxID=31959 RepID=UPI000894BEF4|nr:hypothetical protein [Amycolatopsis lurida]SED40324.1 hypothetical protein SAMN04489729_4250 [Amycolatopsis lurida]